MYLFEISEHFYFRRLTILEKHYASPKLNNKYSQKKPLLSYRATKTSTQTLIPPQNIF